ncbi:MAG: GGDEF domain-containing protein [Candidatus Cloacimonetes bacterium]|nr:GGDEF domain-containing protein [Candidatus Cloacimonadota bacterium]
MIRSLRVVTVLIILIITLLAAEPIDDKINFLPEKDRAEYFFDQGLGYYKVDDQLKALNSFQEALEIYLKRNDKANIARCYNNMGNIYNNISMYNKAMEIHLKSLEIEEELGEKKGIISSLNNIGNIFKNISEFDQALENYQRALNLSYEIQDDKSISITLNNVGNIHLCKEDFENALEFYSRSLILKEKLQDNQSIASTYNNIGISYQGLKMYQKALQNYNKSLNMMNLLQNGNGIATAYLHIGIIHKEQNDTKNALFNLEKALNFAQNHNNKQIMLSCYNLLSEIYSEQKDYYKAFTAMKLYAQLKENMVSAQTQKTISELQISYETEKKQNEIEKLQTDADHNKLVSKRNDLFLIILVIILIVVAVLGFFGYFELRQKTSANKIIEEKNVELTVAYKKMEELARTDMLTGLSNRRDMYQNIKHETDRFERNENPFTILMADIDNFKKVNDTYGHAAGDYVLTSISKLMISFMRKQDIVGRWGGEEFLLLLPDTDLDGGKKIAEKLRKRIKNEIINFKDYSINITVTIGVSVYDRIHDVSESIKEADKAMYFGKIRNKDCVISTENI